MYRECVLKVTCGRMSDAVLWEGQDEEEEIQRENLKVSWQLCGEKKGPKDQKATM